jgi:hypothetical protein
MACEMILIALRPEDARDLLQLIPRANPLHDIVKGKIYDQLWNPQPPRARTITIRDEGDSLPLLAVSVDFDCSEGVEQIWEETEIEWPSTK